MSQSNSKWEKFKEKLDALAEEIKRAQEEEKEAEDVEEVFAEAGQVWRIGDYESLGIIAPTVRVQLLNRVDVLYSIILLNGKPWNWQVMNTSMENIQQHLLRERAAFVAPSFDDYLEYATRED